MPVEISVVWKNQKHYELFDFGNNFVIIDIFQVSDKTGFHSLDIYI